MRLARSLARRIKWQVTALRARVAPTGVHRWDARDEESAARYWSSRQDGTNRFLYEQLDAVPFKSVLEVGSNCGNRLFQLAVERPDVRIAGIDINPAAINYGRQQFSRLGIGNVELNVSDARALRSIDDGSFDVVFSWATLIYVKPKHIKGVLSAMLRLARKALILIEMHDAALPKSKAAGVLVPPGNWKRNYDVLLTQLPREVASVACSPVPAAVWQPGGGFASVVRATKVGG